MKNKMILLCLILQFLLGGLTAQVQTKLSGGGDLNPDLRVPYKAQQDFLDLRVGLSVHWGPSALGGKEISWSRGAKIPRETYDAYYKEFNPVHFDADEWCRLMKRWGIKFIAPTAKHHDGFALWFSDYSEYDMEQAKLKIDIMKELQQACRKHDIMLGTYYSNLDWYHPDWAPYQFGGPGDLFPKQTDSPNLERYFEYMENQVVELIEKYDVKFIQFDGEWDSTYTHEVGSKLYRRFRQADPNVLLSNRIDIGRRSQGASNHMYIDGQKYCGDFLDRERLVNQGNNVTEWYDDAWQAWVTIDKSQWSYNKTPQLMTARELIDDAIHVLGSNGNYMINLGPRPDGSFDSQQIALMDSLGAWLHHYDKAIYGTRGGPYYPFKEGVCTQKGKKAWLFITDRQATQIALPSLDRRIKKAVVYDSQDEIAFDDSSLKTLFQLPPSNGQDIRVIELTLSKKDRDRSKGLTHATYIVPERFNSHNVTHQNNFKSFDFVYVMAFPQWKAEDFDGSQSEINQKYVEDFSYNKAGEKMAQVPELIQNVQKTDCKILLSFPGHGYDVIARDPQRRIKFARMMAAFVQKHNYDGIELDWENTITIPDHLAFIKDIRTSLDQLAMGKYMHLATALNCSHQYTPEQADELSEHLDFINVMMYDIGGGPWSKYPVSFNTPFDFIERNLATNWHVFDRSKLSVGLANYGYGYNGVKPNSPLPQGVDLTKDCFTVNYFELADYLKKGWYERWCDRAKSSYFFSPDGSSFFSLDTPKAIRHKVEWAEKEGYAGVFWWEYHMDIEQSSKDKKRSTHLLMDGVKELLK